MKYIPLFVAAIFLSVSTVNAAEELLPAPRVIDVIAEETTSTPTRAPFEYIPVAPTADALQDTTVAPSEFNISRTLILPDNRLYGVKQTIRRTVLALTWRQKSRTEKKLIYANRMLVEAWELSKKGGKKDIIIKTLQESNALVPSELPNDRLIRRALRAQIIFDELGAELPTASVVGSASVEEIVTAVESLPGSVFKHFKAIELLHELNRGDVQDALLARLKVALETSPIQTREQFDDYVLGLSGNPIRHFMIMDALRSSQEFAPDFVTQLDITKGKLAVKIVSEYGALPPPENSLLREQFVLPLFEDDHIVTRFQASRAGVQLEQYASGELKLKMQDAISIIRKAYDDHALASESPSVVGDPDIVDLVTYDRINFPIGVNISLIRMAERIGKEGYGFSGRFADPALLEGVEVLKRLRARYPSLVGSFNRVIEVQEAKKIEFEAAF